MKIAILGAGVSGLTAARRLSRHAEVTVFEAKDRPGGNIRTDEVDGCLIEWGPNGFLDNEPATLELVEELGLGPRVARAREEAARRFIWRAGKLRELPTSPKAFLLGDALPLFQRLRIGLEPFAKKAPGHDESVFDFAKRHLGRGAAEVLIDAFVTGIFAGDPKRLSVRSAFPKLKALEDQYGSLIKGAKGRGPGPSGTLTSFDGGLQVLVDALAEGVDVRYGAQLETLPEGFDHVLCTIPAPRAADLVPAELGGLLRRIPTAPVVVVAMVFRDDLLQTVPDAFGFLVPRNQGLRMLGTLYDSSIFSGRAPEGRRLFRTLLGGRRDPDLPSLGDDELRELVARELHQVWGEFPDPETFHVIRHPLGICQYEIGHADLLEQIEAACPADLRLAGASYRGVALNACVKEARTWLPPGVESVGGPDSATAGGNAS